MEVLINDEAGSPYPHGELEALSLFVLTAEGAPPGCELSVSLVSEDKMAELNGYYLEREGPTDVLSFPMGEEWDGSYILGDVIICPGEVERRKELYGVERGDESRLVLIHGILHLLGYGDEDEGENRRMDERQRELLSGWKGERG